MLGLMQTQGLMISSILTHAARHHASAEVISRTHENTTHRYTWRDVEARSRRLVRVLQKLGVGAGDRVGTLAWNGYRHLEVYYAAPGMEAICHTINPRLHPDDVAYITLFHIANSWAVRKGLTYIARADEQTLAMAVEKAK